MSVIFTFEVHVDIPATPDNAAMSNSLDAEELAGLAPAVEKKLLRPKHRFQVATVRVKSVNRSADGSSVRVLVEVDGSTLGRSRAPRIIN